MTNDNLIPDDDFFTVASLRLKLRALTQDFKEKGYLLQEEVSKAEWVPIMMDLNDAIEHMDYLLEKLKDIEMKKLMDTK